jgi:hypothetical protein
MDSDEHGRLFGIVDPTPGNFSTDAVCSAGCLLERIEVASRTIEAKVLVHLSAGGIVAFRHDATTNGMVVGYRLPGRTSFASDTYPGYKVTFFGGELFP